MSERDQDEEQDVVIKRADFRKLVPNAAILLIGIRRSGKSVLAATILHELCKTQRIDRVYVLTRTKVNGYWLGNKHVTKVYDKHFDVICMTILAAQERRWQLEFDKHGDAERAQQELPRVCIVLDDIMGAIAHKSEALTTLTTSGRHFMITIICNLQDYTGLSPDVRTNCDYIVLFENVRGSAVDLAYTEIPTSMGLSREEFEGLYLTITRKPYHSMMISRTSRSQKIEDRVFVAKGRKRFTPEALQKQKERGF